MKKLTAMVVALFMASTLLGGCYSKSCDTGCPRSTAAVETPDATPAETSAAAAPAADETKTTAKDKTAVAPEAAAASN